MTKKDKDFLKENYNIDVEKMSLKELKQALAMIIKRNNTIIYAKYQKNNLLVKELEIVSNEQ